MKYLAVLACLVLTGCATGFATTGARNAEFSWLALHAIDTAQTMTIARSPSCFYEANPLASAVYGTKHPSVKRVVITNTATGLLHWQAGAWLDRRTEYAFKHETGSEGALYVARLSYYALSIMGTGTAVLGNVRLGIKPNSRKECAP